MWSARAGEEDGSICNDGGCVQADGALDLAGVGEDDGLNGAGGGGAEGAVDGGGDDLGDGMSGREGEGLKRDGDGVRLSVQPAVELVAPCVVRDGDVGAGEDGVRALHADGCAYN